VSSYPTGFVMMTSQRLRLGMIHECVVDLRNNGIDLRSADSAAVRRVVHQHLDYFQMMLGGEPGEREVIALIESETRRRRELPGLSDHPN
jgi:hypothetical protein